MELEKEIQKIRQEFKRELEVNNSFLLEENIIRGHILSNIYTKILKERYPAFEKRVALRYKMFFKKISIGKEVMSDLGYVEMHNINGLKYLKKSYLKEKEKSL